MKTSKFSFSLLLLWCAHPAAQDYVKYSSTASNGDAMDVTSTLSLPKKPPAVGTRSPAVILLHTGAGWESPIHAVTEQYAKALTEAGFLVLEPRLFATAASAPTVGPSVLPMVYDALRYLAVRGDVDSKRIGVAGFSFGGALALHSAASWAQEAYAKSPDLKFAAHAPFYPSCGLFSAFAQGKRKTPLIPVDAFTKWTGVPVRIFAGGRDDYDNQDPNACAEFISHVPTAYRSNFSVKLYPEATHGWDQQSAKFYDRIACNGRGCMNSNEANPIITQRSISDLVEFFRDTLAMSQK